MTLLTLSAIALATLVTSFISGILGMAGGMILMGVLILLLPLPAAMLLHGITQLSANGWRAAMLRGSIDWPVVRGYVAGAFIALAIFGAVQVVVGKPAALLVLGLMPFVAIVLRSGCTSTSSAAAIRSRAGSSAPASRWWRASRARSSTSSSSARRWAGTRWWRPRR